MSVSIATMGHFTPSEGMNSNTTVAGGGSISVGTMGLFTPSITVVDSVVPPAAIVGISAGGGGGRTQYIERKKPVVQISRVRYDKYKKKKVEIISIEEV